MLYQNAIYKSIKVVVIGDNGVGKTCTLTTYAGGDFKTIHENIQQSIVKIDVVEVSDKDELEIRTQKYIGADFFILCYSIKEETSFSHIKNKWIAEITQKNASANFIIVGLKSDLRLAALITGEKIVSSFDKAKEDAKMMGAIEYFECSSFQQDSVDDVFDFAFKEAVKRSTSHCRKKKINKCSIC